MEWLNYHHLYYFWTVAREGSISKATHKLHLAQPTLSAQIKSLENSLNEKLFEKSGRGLALTEVGQTVYRYAEDIFSLGKELQDTLKGRPTGKPLTLHIGIADNLHKLIAFKLVEPALKLKEEIKIVCMEDRPEKLLSELALHNLDIVISDAPIPPSIHIKAFHHLLGESDIHFFGSQSLVKNLKRNFPQSLNSAPFLLPSPQASLRRDLERWFEENKIFPKIMGEFQDSALMKVFAQSGYGIFAGPSVISKEICSQYDVGVIGKPTSIKEKFYAISYERKIKNPAVLAICEQAKSKIFF